MSTSDFDALLGQIDPEARALLAGHDNAHDEGSIRYLLGLSPEQQRSLAGMAARLGGRIGTDIRVDPAPPNDVREARSEDDAVVPDPEQSPSPVGEAPDPAPIQDYHDYPAHPVAALFPMMGDHELGLLAADIREHGQRDAIELFEQQVIDGRSRQAACGIAGEPPRYVEWDGKGSLVAYVLSKNLHRRHLTDQQRAMIAAKAKLEFEKEARSRSTENLKQFLAPTEGRDPAPRSGGKSADKAAALLNVTVNATKKASKVLKAGDPALVAAVEKQEVSLDAASAVASRPKLEQRKLVKTGKVREAAKGIREAKHAGRATAPEPTPSGSALAEHPASAVPAPGTPAPITFKFALTVVEGVVARKGKALARKVIERIAAEVDLDVWVACDSTDEGDDLGDLAAMVRTRLDAFASRDIESAQSWVESHVESLQDVLVAAGPEDDYGAEYDE